jgi:hypothetical protein
VQELHLHPTGEKRSFFGPIGGGTLDVYFIDLLLPFNGEVEFIQHLEVLGLPCELYGADRGPALLGLDILCRGTLIMGNGQFTFTIP